MFESFKKNLPLPAYDQCLKASHIFNLLNSRGIIEDCGKNRIYKQDRGIGKRLWIAWQVPKIDMADFLLELYSEDTAKLQINARKQISDSFISLLNKEGISFKKHDFFLHQKE